MKGGGGGRAGLEGMQRQGVWGAVLAVLTREQEAGAGCERGGDAWLKLGGA